MAAVLGWQEQDWVVRGDSAGLLFQGDESGSPAQAVAQAGVGPAGSFHEVQGDSAVLFQADESGRYAQLVSQAGVGPAGSVHEEPTSFLEAIAIDMPQGLGGRTPEELALMTAVWNQYHDSNPYRWYQQMQEHGWTVRDMARVSGRNWQSIGDDLLRLGAPPGFGGRSALTREAVMEPYLAAARAAESQAPPPPWAVDLPPGWVRTQSAQQGDESGPAVTSTQFDLLAFTSWYMAQNTPDSQTFARIHGAVSSDGAGGVVFASGASLAYLSVDEAGHRNLPVMSWAVDPRVGQYASFGSLNALDQATLWMMTESPENKALLAAFGGTYALPENELGERMRALYGSDLATTLYRLSQALLVVRESYTLAMQQALSTPPNPDDVMPPGWTVDRRFDEDGAPDHKLHFDASAFHNWYIKQAPQRNQLLGQLYGTASAALPDGSYGTSGTPDGLSFKAAYDGLAFDEGGHPTYFIDTSQGNLAPINLASAPELLDNAQVIFRPGTGFVTPTSNFKPEDPDFMEQLFPILFMGAVAWFSAGVLGPQAAAGMGLTTTTTATACVAAPVLSGAGMMVSAAVAGAATSLVSGAMRDDLHFKDVLKGALAGALTSGLFQGVEAYLGAPLSSLGGGVTIAARTTVQGAVQAIMGGSFADGALAGFASGLSEVIGRELMQGISDSVRAGSITPEAARDARYFANMFAASVRIVASGADAPGYALAQEFLGQMMGAVGVAAPAPVAPVGAVQEPGMPDPVGPTEPVAAAPTAPELEPDMPDPVGPTGPVAEAPGLLDGIIPPTPETADPGPSEPVVTQGPPQGTEPADPGQDDAGSGTPSDPPPFHVDISRVGLESNIADFGVHSIGTEPEGQLTPEQELLWKLTGVTYSTGDAARLADLRDVNGSPLLASLAAGTEVSAGDLAAAFARSAAGTMEQAASAARAAIAVAAEAAEALAAAGVRATQVAIEAAEVATAAARVAIAAAGEAAAVFSEVVAVARTAGAVVAVAEISVAAAPVLEFLAGVAIIGTVDLWMTPPSAPFVYVSDGLRFVPPRPGELGSVQEQTVDGRWVTTAVGVTLDDLTAGRIAPLPQEERDRLGLSGRPQPQPPQPYMPTPPANVPPEERQSPVFPGQPAIPVDSTIPPSPVPDQPTIDDIIITTDNGPFTPSRTGPTGQLGGTAQGERTTNTPNAESGNKADIQAENDALDVMANSGYRTERNPVLTSEERAAQGLSGTTNPDARIEGRVFDVKTSTSPQSAESAIKDSVGKGQSRRFVINTDHFADPDAGARQLADRLRTNPIPGLQEVKVIVNGVVRNIYP